MRNLLTCMSRSSRVMLTLTGDAPSLETLLDLHLPCPIVIDELLAARRKRRPCCGPTVRYWRVGLKPRVFSRRFRMTARAMTTRCDVVAGVWCFDISA